MKMTNTKSKTDLTIEKIIISFYLFSHFILLIYMMKTRQLAGDFYGQNIGITLDNIEIITLFAITFVGYLILYWVYKSTYHSHFKTRLKFHINKDRFDSFYFILIIIQTIFVVNTGVGRVFSNTTNKLSPIFSLLNIDCIFGIYYFTCRRKKLLYIFNIVLFIINNLIRGWTGTILTIFFYELYCQFVKGRWKTYLSTFWILISPFLMLGGGILYKVIYPLKMYVRLHFWDSIPFFDALVKLVNRVSFFSVSILAIQNSNIVKNLYWDQGIHFLEFKTMIRAIVPRIFMPVKEFRIFGNLIQQSVYQDIPNNVSSEMGLIPYLYTLICTNLGEIIIWILFIVLVGVFIKFIFESFEEYHGQLNFLWFYFLIDLAKTGSLSLLSFYYLYLIYLIPVMVVCRVIKFVKS